jgi:acyl-CoA synthetase (AMP-forming)/AMP-acid ligase II
MRLPLALVADRAREHPHDAPFRRSGGASLSYAAWVAAARGLRDVLLDELRLAQGDRVLLIFDREAWLEYLGRVRRRPRRRRDCGQRPRGG